MSGSAIKVEGLWKQYTVGAQQQPPGTFYDLLSGALRSPLQRLRKQHPPASAPTQFWALRDLDFEVQPGEVFGVVGRNGAGKSTLLKILSRITAPTRGRITVRGKIASLLEVGTGFHPELTGRENIYLNATILGMKQREIARKLDAIVAFSGVERFLDTPVKRYSSGMYVRLAFAVAAHVDADILLVDEVLAVGDAEFQKRCLGMMGDVARGGRTVLFVSHNLTALRNLCGTGLLMAQGQAQARGRISDVLNQYTRTGASAGQSVVDFPASGEEQAASIRRVAVAPKNASLDGNLTVRTPFSITTHLEVREPDMDIGVYLHCHDGSQNRVFSTGSFFDDKLNGVKLERGQYAFTCEIPADLLNDGEYTLDLMLVRNRVEVITTESAVLSFRIHDTPTGIEGWNWPIVGVIRPKLEWSCVQAAPLRVPNDVAAVS